MIRCQKDKNMSIMIGPAGAFVAPVLLQLSSSDAQLGAGDGDRPGPVYLPRPRPAPAQRYAELKPISIYDSSGRLVEVDEPQVLDDTH